MMSINESLAFIVSDAEASGNCYTACAYRSALKSVLAHMGGDLPDVEFFSPACLALYEHRLRVKGLCNNTVSFYQRMLRAMYNRGVALGLYPDVPDLFAHVYTGIDSTPKRAVSPEIFGRLSELDLSGNSKLKFACDLFLLSFCLQGISFVDLAYLRKSDLRGNLLSYHRAKTGSAITVAVSPLAIELINKYADAVSDSEYLLPIIKDPDGDTRLQYKSALRTYNRRLKKLAGLADIEENLTSYVARHSWATTARNADVPIGVISQGMGHQTEGVTHIYLADYDHSALFLANEKVLAAAHLSVKGLKRSVKPANRGPKKNVSHLGSERRF